MNKAFEKILERLEADEKHTFDGCINKRYAKQIMKDTGLMLRLKALKNYINPNTYRTIKGQIINGDVEGASKGIERIEKTLKKK